MKRRVCLKNKIPPLFGCPKKGGIDMDALDKTLWQRLVDFSIELEVEYKVKIFLVSNLSWKQELKIYSDVYHTFTSKIGDVIIAKEKFSIFSPNMEEYLAGYSDKQQRFAIENLKRLQKMARKMEEKQAERDNAIKTVTKITDIYNLALRSLVDTIYGIISVLNPLPLLKLSLNLAKTISFQRKNKNKNK